MVVYRKVTGGFRSAWGRTCAPPSSRSSTPPPGAGSTPTTPSMPSYRAGPSSPPVEQLRIGHERHRHTIGKMENRRDGVIGVPDRGSGCSAQDGGAWSARIGHE